MSETTMTWRDLKEKVAATRTPQQQEGYEAGLEAAEAQIALSELVYSMR
ncbi:MAG: hypothetical protein LBL92_01310 [Propionibacteriaceae bacterium]|nr:hypothetical protein [Propionibacteriaceae bacterium]